MKLTRQNINEWLTELNRQMAERNVDDIANDKSQNEWLERYEGQDVEDAVSELSFYYDSGII